MATETVKEAWGLCCPGCGRDDALAVQVKSWAKLTPDGTDADDAHEWDQNSACACDACGWGGTVFDAETDE